MDLSTQTLSALTTAALLVLASGCAGPSKDDVESGSAELYLDPAPPAAEAAPQEEGEEEMEPMYVEEEPNVQDGSMAPMEEEEYDDDGYDHDFTVLAMGGTRMLDNSDWEPVDTLYSGGVNLMARGPGGWFHWDLAFFYGDDDGNVLDADEDPVSVSSRVYEIDLGVAKVFDVGIFRPYIGVGAAYVNAEAELFQGEESFSDDDGSFGGYGRAGLMIEVTGTGGLVGVEARYLVGTEVELGDFETDVDGLMGMFTLGFSW